MLSILTAAALVSQNAASTDVILFSKATIPPSIRAIWGEPGGRVEGPIVFPKPVPPEKIATSLESKGYYVERTGRLVVAVEKSLPVMKEADSAQAMLYILDNVDANGVFVLDPKKKESQVTTPIAQLIGTIFPSSSGKPIALAVLPSIGVSSPGSTPWQGASINFPPSNDAIAGLDQAIVGQKVDPNTKVPVPELPATGVHMNWTLGSNSPDNLSKANDVYIRLAIKARDETAKAKSRLRDMLMKLHDKEIGSSFPDRETKLSDLSPWMQDRVKQMILDKPNQFGYASKDAALIGLTSSPTLEFKLQICFTFKRETSDGSVAVTSLIL